MAYVKKYRLVTCQECAEVTEHSDSRVKFCNTKCKNNYNSRKYSANNTDNRKFYFQKLLAGRYRRKTLSVDFLENRFQLQAGKCALSGVEMTWKQGVGKVYTNISIDRINCGGDYSTDNIRLVCSIVNTMRNTLSDEELILWCNKICNRTRG